MLTNTADKPDFSPVLLTGNNARTIHLLKVGGALTAELTVKVQQLEAKYAEAQTKQLIPAMAAQASMISRVANSRGITLDKAKSILFPEKKMLAAATAQVPEVLSPGENDPAPAATDESQAMYYANENELLAMMSRGESGEMKSALLELQKEVATVVLQNRLTISFEVEQADSSTLYSATGAFVPLKKGQRICIGDSTFVVSKETDAYSHKIEIEPHVSPATGTAFVLDANGLPAMYPWNNSLTNTLLESHLAAIYQFFCEERAGGASIESEELYDDLAEAMGNESNGSQPEQPPHPSTGSNSDNVASTLEAMTAAS